jgi:crotonobetainyl-CoA:carnitine CoA-transferase CaiB-like acyl-CoA transferase
VFIAVTGNRHWAGLCDALGFADWKKSAEFDNNRKRGAEKRRIAERITEAVRKLTYDDITQRLYKALVPYAPVGTPLDILDDRQMNEGKRWLPLKIGDKEFKVPKLPISMARTREFETRQQAGTLGAHTDSILAELGYSSADIEALKSQKVVLRSDRMLNIDDPE